MSIELTPFEEKDTYAYQDFEDFIKSKREASQSIVIYLDDLLLDVKELNYMLSIHLSKHNFRNFIKDFLNDFSYFVLYKIYTATKSQDKFLRIYIPTSI